jgi:hypothetical protein
VYSVEWFRQTGKGAATNEVSQGQGVRGMIEAPSGLLAAPALAGVGISQVATITG